MLGDDCEAGDDDAWLQTIVNKLAEDGRAGFPEPERLRALATDDGQRDVVVGLLRAFTPLMLPAADWQNWFDGGASPRELIDPVQFVPGRDSSRRKSANAIGVYEESCRRVAKARVDVSDARSKLEAAEENLAALQAAQCKAAAKAQGSMMWSLLREVSRRVDKLSAVGPAAKLIDALLEGLLPSEIEGILREADADDAHERIGIQKLMRAQRARKVLAALEGFDVNNKGQVNAVRTAISEALKA